MPDRNINEMPLLAKGDFTANDQLLVWDSASGSTTKAPISTVALISGTKGGFTFSGGFENRQYTGIDARIVLESEDVDKWIPMDFSADAQASTDAPWWPGAAPSNGIDLFGGTALPYDVTRMLDFDQTWDWSSYSDTATANYGGSIRTGTFRFDELDTGTTNLIRIDMNITPMIANTTVEVGLWFQPKQALDGANDGGAFPLPGSPLFFGTGTVGRTFLSRPTSTMYIASKADQFAYALPVFKSDNPVMIEPLSMLCQNLR